MRVEYNIVIVVKEGRYLGAKDVNYVVGLLGNPNVGKSSVFNGLTGLHQHTGNWTGKTVEKSVGTYIYDEKNFEIVDLPGTYSLESYSMEEEVSREFVLSSEYNSLVVVVDATCLERNLNLVLQILSITKNVVICVNLLDEAKRKNIKIDLIKLEQILGVPVVGTVATNKENFDVLKEKIEDVSKKKLEKNINKDNDGIDAEYIAKEVIDKADNILTKNLKIDKILTSKIFGIPIMIAMLGVIFWITIVGANYPSKLLSKIFGIGKLKLEYLFDLVGIDIFIKGMILDGVYQTVSWIISVMLPPMTIFFPLFTLLEDLGVLPRIAFNLDNFFRKAGTCGKQALTMCMGFGCNAVGVVGCKIMRSTREKLISMITNVFVPCNGRFPLLITVATIFFAGSIGGFKGSFLSTIVVLAIIIFGIFLSLIVSKILSKTLPPYRKPKVGAILVRSILDRTIFVLGRAICVAIPAGFIIWIMANVNVGSFSLLYYVANFFDPLGRLMGLDGYILTAFIFGIPANEIVLPIILMVYMNNGTLVDIEDTKQIGEILISNGWTILTAINVMIFTLIHFPCMTTLLTIKKESGSYKWMMLSIAIPTVCGVLICCLSNLIFSCLFPTFVL